MWESHTDLLVWVQKDVSMVTESRKQANAPTASTSKNDSHLKTHRFFHKKKSSFRRGAETNARDPHTAGRLGALPIRVNLDRNRGDPAVSKTTKIGDHGDPTM
jgi:hypothetical protein